MKQVTSSIISVYNEFGECALRQQASHESSAEYREYAKQQSFWFIGQGFTVKIEAHKGTRLVSMRQIVKG